MNSENLLEKSESLWNNLLIDIENISAQSNIEKFQNALMATDEAIRQLKTWVKPHQFDTWEREIRFFKTIKPKFIAKFIYFSKVIALETSLPSSGIKNAKREYESEFSSLYQFGKENSEFIAYWRKKATYLDSKFFLRFRYDLNVKLAGDLHSYDETFSTSHDNLVANIIANEYYENYLKSKIKKLKNDDNFKTENYAFLHWSGSKAGLVELILALYVSRCFNSGNVELASFVREVEKNWSIDLGNYHKTIIEIKNRKINRTKFLQNLTSSLESHFDNIDEY